MFVFWFDALVLRQVVDVDADFAGRRFRVVDAHDDAARIDVVDLAAAARHAPPCRSRPPPCARRRCRRAASRRAGTAPPGAACSSPSTRGSRRRARGTESATRPPTRSAPAPRPCTGSCRAIDSMNSLRLRHDTSSSASLPLLVDLRVRLRDHVLAFLDRRQVMDLVGDLAVDDLAVRRLEEAVFVGARVQRERVDEADVRAFRRLDRAHAAVVRRMHVAHFEARALAREAARARAPRRGACA